MTECAICRGTGFAPISTERGAPVRPCACRRHDVPGLPVWCRGVRLDDLASIANGGILIGAREWLDDPTTPRADLYLFGTTGTGKTTLSAALLAELAHRDARTLFVSVAKFVRVHVDAVTIAELKTEARALHRRVCTVDVLCLDDVAANEKSSDFSRGLLTAIIDERLAAGRTTIWTSNLNLVDLAAFYDDRLVSRIVGACRNHIFEFGGPDLRLDSHSRTALARGPRS